jgi:hypothetical protein
VKTITNVTHVAFLVVHRIKFIPNSISKNDLQR